jgi:integrase
LRGLDDDARRAGRSLDELSGPRALKQLDALAARTRLVGTEARRTADSVDKIGSAAQIARFDRLEQKLGRLGGQMDDLGRKRATPSTMRFATPEEAVRLLAAVPGRDRAVWTTAMYSGLRRGELMALRWTDVDLKGGTISVERSWDPEHGPGDTKNRDRRRVPIAAALRERLVAERLRQPPGLELCFGLGPDRPFRPDGLQDRADAAWVAAGLARLTLHDCRHTFASLAIAAGVNFKALSGYMGHSSVAITLDRYGHLMPGNEAEAADLLDTYLGANTR